MTEAHIPRFPSASNPTIGGLRSVLRRIVKWEKFSTISKIIRISNDEFHYLQDCSGEIPLYLPPYSQDILSFLHIDLKMPIFLSITLWYITGISYPLSVWHLLQIYLVACGLAIQFYRDLTLPKFFKIFGTLLYFRVSLQNGVKTSRITIFEYRIPSRCKNSFLDDDDGISLVMFKHIHSTASAFPFDLLKRIFVENVFRSIRSAVTIPSLATFARC